MIESILRFSIARRWLMMSMILVLIGLGYFSYQKLPIDAVPDITNVQVQINTRAPGYSPLETEQRITVPIETTIRGIPALSYTRSISRYGLSQVTVVFNEGTDLYFARSLINEKLSALKNVLPNELSPEMGPISTGLGEIFMYSIEASPTAKQADGSPFDATALREIQDWIIKPQLSLVKGVTEINTIGGYDKQYHITPWPSKMLEFSITFDDIHKALNNNNSNRGAGYIEQNGQQLMVRSPGQLATITDIEQVVIKLVDDTPVKIKDIAEVAIGKSLRTGAATRSGTETVIGSAMMLMGENSRVVALAVAEKLEQIKLSLPDGVIVEAVYDRTTLVDKAMYTVQKNLAEGALLVIVILFLLLGNIRAALITAAVIPLAMLATITGMVKAGVSANLMSLGALDFGLIVDGAVIIVENSIRRLSDAQRVNGSVLSKKERLAVVYSATNEVIRPSLFGIFIITIVYIPLFSLSGVEGKMFHPMAATVMMALIAALVLSLTLVPAAVALFMTGKIKEQESRIITVAKSAYKPLLLAAMKLRWLILTVCALFVAFSLWLATTLGSEFIPQLNEEDLLLQAIRITGTSLNQSIDMQQNLEREIQKFPQVKNVFSRIGTPEIANDPMPPNIADTYVMYIPREQWPDPSLSYQDLAEQIVEAVSGQPGNNFELTQPIEMRFNELISGVRADLGIKVIGDDLNQLLRSANEIREVLETINGASDIQVEQVTGLPMLSIIPKRIELARYGLTVAQLQHALATAIGGENAGAIYEGDRRFNMVIRLPEQIRNDIHRLGELPIAVPTSQSSSGYVPLSEVANLEIAPAPNQISRENGKRRIVVTANVRGTDLGTFVNNAKQEIQQQVDIPAGYWLEYGGTFEQLASANKRLTLVIPITLGVILGLLVMVFGSVKDALIIYTGIPLALTGGVITLWLRDMPLSTSAGVGFIALSGIATLNGLVMLSFIRDLVKERGEVNSATISSHVLQKAIIDGAMLRLRPVLMTALVAGLGFVPMALNVGTGAEVQQPLATVVIGGIISSTLLTLLVLPVLYRLVHQGERRARS
ncbi:efflux RND transporter permease subunit [Colwellia echini]|uniref:CusA/CzcA family heavy metal efflux RND transporter n=1 Tax=Colwellia echini TaxID=1982103 RepID=A0ABY3MXM4_9GAMM|nr:CusA/CzcA family heavy metal efflux RND transporter [Colwellia echini]TYK65782.1 CusA/CzcA family heavy metal efflux RND transporter [Colwellia echini]